MIGCCHPAGVALRAIGTGLRAIRIRARLTQVELSIAADVPRSVVQAIERERINLVRVGDLRAVAAALDATLDLSIRWRGGDLPRLVNARHAAIHEIVATRYLPLPEWLYEPEVSFSSYGERGVVDGLGWHAATRTLLVHEYKSELVDLSDLMGTVDQKTPPRAGDRPLAGLAAGISLDLGRGHRQPIEPPSTGSARGRPPLQVPR